MIASLLNAALLSGIETGINQIMAMDPRAEKQLASLSGKVLRIHCEPPGMSLNVLICDKGIMLSGNEELAYDAMIAGSPMSLLKRLVTRDTGNLQADGMELRGDTGVVNALQSIFSGMDVDWEYRLSKLIGDIPTQMLSDGLQHTSALARRTSQNVTRDVDAWLHEERKLVPSTAEVEQFYRRINSLRLHLDRLQARSNLLHPAS
jgi:ubiquinone biosynthesis protein UbiJ